MIEPRISDTQRTIGEWARKTFPDGTAAATSAHLTEEVAELHNAVLGEKPRAMIAEELADVAILAFTLADMMSISLAESINWKHAINQRRNFAYSASHGYDKKTALEKRTYGVAFTARDYCLPGREDHDWSVAEIAGDNSGWIAGMVFQMCRVCGSCVFVADGCAHEYDLMAYDDLRDDYFRQCHKCYALLYLRDAEMQMIQTARALSDGVLIDPPQLFPVTLSLDELMTEDGSTETRSELEGGIESPESGVPVADRVFATLDPQLSAISSRYLRENAPTTSKNAPTSDEAPDDVETHTLSYIDDIEAFLAFVSSSLAPLFRQTADALDSFFPARDHQKGVVPRDTAGKPR